MIRPLRETFALPSWMLSVGVMGAGAQMKCERQRYLQAA